MDSVSSQGQVWAPGNVPEMSSWATDSVIGIFLVKWEQLSSQGTYADWAIEEEMPSWGWHRGYESEAPEPAGRFHHPFVHCLSQSLFAQSKGARETGWTWTFVAKEDTEFPTFLPLFPECWLFVTLPDICSAVNLRVLCTSGKDSTRETTSLALYALLLSQLSTQFRFTVERLKWLHMCTVLSYCRCRVNPWPILANVIQDSWISTSYVSETSHLLLPTRNVSTAKI